jgi:hypothetical protein
MIRLTGMKRSLTLEELKSEYSSALYSYFRVTNLKESYEKFKQNPSKPPRFKYSKNTNLSNVNDRLKALHKILLGIDPANEAEVAFIEWRVAEALLLKEFRNIYEKNSHAAPELIDKYIADQEELYGPLDKNIFGGIMRYIRITSHRRGEEFTKVMKAIDRRVGEYPDNHLFTPKEATFQHYKHLFSECFPELHKSLSAIRTAERYSKLEVISVFERALEAVGAKKAGWEVIIADGGANIISAKYSKKVLVGRDFQPTSSLRFKQIVAHEVGCHVQRAITDQHAGSQAEFDEDDEGLAIMLEQLLAARFMYKRALRYLAICLAVGLDGQKRDFCEVYDILWRATYIVSGDKKRAKEQAFYETARAFRGGIPSVAGLVYIKDKIYLESNLLVWEKLEEQQLDKAEFRGLFRSHDSQLAKEIVP